MKKQLTIFARRVLKDDQWLEDQVITIKDGIIQNIAPGLAGDLETDLLVPGMIDNHNHGGNGCSIMTSEADLFVDWLEGLAKNGTTAVVASPYTASVSDIRAALKKIQRIQSLQQAGQIGGARLLGVHLEGPYVSRERPGIGAMDERYIAEPSIEHYLEMVTGFESLVLEITLAPERDNGLVLTSYLKKKGIRVLAGHTNASYHKALEAFDAGVDGICHFYNASIGIHHREPGILVAALLNKDIYCEAICDFAHVHPAALKLLLKVKSRDRIMIVSDAVKMAGMPDCEYIDGGDRIIHKDGVSRLKSGGLAGGGAYVLHGVKKLVSIGIPLKDAIIMGSRTPAQWLGLKDLGRIDIGCRADLLALDQELNIKYTLVGEQLTEG